MVHDSILMRGEGIRCNHSTTTLLHATLATNKRCNKPINPSLAGQAILFRCWVDRSIPSTPSRSVRRPASRRRSLGAAWHFVNGDAWCRTGRPAGVSATQRAAVRVHTRTAQLAAPFFKLDACMISLASYTILYGWWWRMIIELMVLLAGPASHASMQHDQPTHLHWGLD